MEDDNLNEVGKQHPATVTSQQTQSDSSAKEAPAIPELQANERQALRTAFSSNNQSAQTGVTFKEYLKANALPLLIITILLVSSLVQTVQIAKLRKSVDTLSVGLGVMTGTVQDSSNSIAELKSKLKDDKQSQIELLRKLKAEYTSGYEQILAKEKYLNQLSQNSTIEKVEAALEHFWEKILGSFK